MSKVIPPPQTQIDDKYREVEYYACADTKDFPAGVHIIDNRGHEYLTVTVNYEGVDHVAIVELSSGVIVLRDCISAPYIAKSNLFV